MKKLLMFAVIILTSTSIVNAKTICPTADKVERALNKVLNSEEAYEVASQVGMSRNEIMATSFMPLSLELKESLSTCHYHIKGNREYFYEITRK